MRTFCSSGRKGISLINKGSYELENNSNAANADSKEKRSSNLKDSIIKKFTFAAARTVCRSRYVYDCLESKKQSLITYLSQYDLNLI